MDTSGEFSIRCIQDDGRQKKTPDKDKKKRPKNIPRFMNNDRKKVHKRENRGQNTVTQH